MSSKHVVVTGAAGFIGSHTCEALTAAGHRVTGVDSFDSLLYSAERKRRNAAGLERSLGGRGFVLVEADICDPIAMDRICGGPDVDVVCHLAALAGVRPSIAEPQKYIRTNLQGTTTILEAMRRGDRRRLVFASSSSVYGARPNGDPGQVQAFREDDPCLQPASPYAATKRAGELLCSTYRDLFGIGVTALRFFTVYGPRQRSDMAIHKFVDGIARGNTITMFGDGSARRDYTFIADIVSGLVASCERVEPGAFSILNLGNTRTTALAELIERIEHTVGKKAIIDRQPDQPGDVPITYADISRAQAELGYAPATDLAAGLRAFWDWYQAQ